jgi:hypothetical protein
MADDKTLEQNPDEGGVGGWLRDKLTPRFIKDVNEALAPTPGVVTPATPAAAAPIETKTPEQKRYEANERYLNRNNPYYKNVDNSGLTKESLP